MSAPTNIDWSKDTTETVAVDALPGAYDGLDNAYTQLVSGLGAGLQDVEDRIWARIKACNWQSATGDDLERIGQLAGVYRGPETEEEYRLAIACMAAAQAAQATLAGLWGAYGNIKEQGLIEGALIWNIGTASVRIQLHTGSSRLSTFVSELAVRIAEQAGALGVSLVVVEQLSTDDDPEPNSFVFGKPWSYKPLAHYDGNVWE